jgi:hypothetical protein
MTLQQFEPFESFILGSVAKMKQGVIKGIKKEEMADTASSTYLVVEKIGSLVNEGMEKGEPIKVGMALKIGQDALSQPMWLKFADRPNYEFILFTRHDVLGFVHPPKDEMAKRLKLISLEEEDVDTEEKPMTPEQLRASMLVGLTPLAKSDKDTDAPSGGIIMQ